MKAADCHPSLTTADCTQSCVISVWSSVWSESLGTQSCQSCARCGTRTSQWHCEGCLCSSTTASYIWQHHKRCYSLGFCSFAVATPTIWILKYTPSRHLQVCFNMSFSLPSQSCFYYLTFMSSQCLMPIPVHPLLTVCILNSLTWLPYNLLTYADWDIIPSGLTAQQPGQSNKKSQVNLC